ncbi:MAG: excinuclease ABC subunit UvrA [Tidjanibacter sp.]|nr:excinuclease ABC subunit UvrA [Tidjanibacter sp.]
MKERESIIITGARVNNLKNIDLEIPRNQLVVITGLSGSGKSSLAFDTIYAEGQRRYMDTLSAYARQFIGNMERPEVDKIEGLSPVVAIEQKTTNRNPRSTVGTVTEINDFLRLLYARAATAYSPITGEEMVHFSDQQIVELIKERYDGKRAAILAPVVRGRKGHYRELFENFLKKGYLYARIDGEVMEMTRGMRLDRYKVHDIELVVDRLVVDENVDDRLMTSLREAMRQGKGVIAVYEYSSGEMRYFSRHLMCPTTGVSFNDPAPHTFSFNSPQGACPHCNGLGEEMVFDMDKIIPDKAKSIRTGGIEPLSYYKDKLLDAQLEALGRRYGFTLDEPLESLSEEALSAILYGEAEPLTVDMHEISGVTYNRMVAWEGVAEYIQQQDELAANSSKKAGKWLEQFVNKMPCSVCGGSRLKKEALQFKIAGLDIAQVSAMSIDGMIEWVKELPEKLSAKQKLIAEEILKEIAERLDFLSDVGLGYLTLNRASRTLSGGESQRIRLATQIGSKLVNVLYILDEPSIGLHQRDNRRLIDGLNKLRGMGNSIIVVEHDEEMMRNADYLVDIGPGAGVAGGYVVAAGTLEEVLKTDSLTADYLNGTRKIEVPKNRRTGNGKSIVVKGARGNNLKDVTVEFPLGVIICVTGVSGSGKSTLVDDTLRAALSRELYRSYDKPLDFDAIEGLENIDKMVVVDQAPIGRTPRSNPATYTGVFGDIRKLFEKTPDAQIRGYKAGRFSFNVKGGHCETCHGAGVQTIEMNFLPDVYVTCRSCNGKRYNRETLEVKYKGKNINDVLNMTIDDATEFFANIPSIYTKLHAVQSVGLGYLKLGQPCTTLSGGECQRIKLASELAKRDTGKTLYIFDEPTTGLHFEDIRQLLSVLGKLVEKGNTVLIIEHNLDVVKFADHVIDMGPDGGDAGGQVVDAGTPEEVAARKRGYTGEYLAEML